MRGTGLSTSGIVVIVVCTLIGVFLLAVVGLFVLRRLRSQQRKARSRPVTGVLVPQPGFSPQSVPVSGYPDAVEMQHYNLSLPANMPPEMGGGGDALSTVHEGEEEEAFSEEESEEDYQHDKRDSRLTAVTRAE